LDLIKEFRLYLELKCVRKLKF